MMTYAPLLLLKTNSYNHILNTIHKLSAENQTNNDISKINLSVRCVGVRIQIIELYCEIRSI